MIKKWVEEDWNNIFHNPSTPGSSGKMFHANMYRLQQTPDEKHWLHKCKLTLINIPGSTTSRVEPLDVSNNKPFKNYVCELLEQHFDANLQFWVESLHQMRKMTTKWVGESWHRVKKQKDLIKQTFKKCGLSKNLDGGEDALFNIKSIEGYWWWGGGWISVEFRAGLGLGVVLYTLCTFYCTLMIFEKDRLHI